VLSKSTVDFYFSSFLSLAILLLLLLLLLLSHPPSAPTIHVIL
jgi:hypothetical protein